VLSGQRLLCNLGLTGERVSGFGFWVLGFRFRVSGFWLLVSVLCFGISSFGFASERVWGFVFRVPGVGFRNSCFELGIWNLGFGVPGRPSGSCVLSGERLLESFPFARDVCHELFPDLQTLPGSADACPWESLEFRVQGS